MAPEDGDDGDRTPCRYCGRKFASDRLATHEDICATASKKRPTFNAQKQRLQGTELAGYFNPRNAKKNDAKKPNDMINGEKKYKVEHENLVAALRAARRYAKYEDDKAAGKAVGPPPKGPALKEVPDDRIQCPGCGRKFGETQYERHRQSCTGAGTTWANQRRHPAEKKWTAKKEPTYDEVDYDEPMPAHGSGGNGANFPAPRGGGSRFGGGAAPPARAAPSRGAPPARGGAAARPRK